MGTKKTVKPRIPGGRVLDLAGLVEYGEGAIVSRTLVQNDAGTVSAFAFDAGQELCEHTAPFDALVQVFEGKGNVIIGGELFQLCTGQIVLMPADIPHAVQATTRFKMLLTMLRAKGT